MTFQIAGFILNKTTKLKNIYFLNPLSDTCVFLELKTIRIDILIINYEQWVLLPISNYRLLIGKSSILRLGSGENPHYSIEVVDDTQQYRVAVNVQSDDHSEVEYVIFPNWDHPIKDHIQKLPSVYIQLIIKMECQPWIIFALILPVRSHLFLFL